MKLRAMKTKLLATFLLMASAPMLATADHDCSESFPKGYEIKRSERLPSSWLTLGDHIVIDKAHHDAIRQEFREYFSANAGYFCVHANGVYITVSNDEEFGPAFEFSANEPKCDKCRKVKENDNRLISKVGLSIGQSKAEVAALLGIKFDTDIVEVSFEEMEKGGNHDTWHEQKLRLEFHSNKLTRFRFFDYREAA